MKQRIFDPVSFPITRLEKPWFLPKQDNYFDCGLFLLTYMQFFVYSLPTEISKQSLLRLPGEPCCAPFSCSYRQNPCTCAAFSNPMNSLAAPL